MNKSKARKIAETVSKETLRQMFLNAQSSIKDWTKVSVVNKGISKGAAFNIFTKGGLINAKSHILAKTNAIREFGEFLPDYAKEIKQHKKEINIIHQEPVKIKDNIL